MKVNTILFRIFLLLLIVPLSFNQSKATPLNISITQSNVSCNANNNGQATATVTGGNAPYTYGWSTTPSQTTATATGLSAGTYTIGVVDASFNTATASVTITQPATLVSIIATEISIGCNGGNGGALFDSAMGGTTPYAYLWMPGGQTSATVTGLTAGCYTVSTVDARGCTVTTTTCITQPAVLVLNPSSVNNSNCAHPNGSAMVSPSGGTSPYIYSWSPIRWYGPTLNSLTPGTYNCTVTDANGCSASVAITVGGTAAPLVTLSSTDDSDMHCTGTLTASVTGGSPPYTYAWSPGGYTTATVNNVCTNFYSCIVTDQSGCTDSNAIMVDTCCMVYCANNYVQPICIVTLDTATNKCEIVWGRTNSPPSGGFGHFNIYRDTNFGYAMVHSQALNVLSEYVDLTSNPSLGPVSYELSTTDSCGESSLSSPHTSIYLTTTAGVGVYILNWTAYVGFTPTEYIIYRGASLSSLAPIDTVSNATLTFHDTLPPLGSYYVLEAVSPNGPCVPTAHRAGMFSLLSGAFSNGFNTGILGINALGNNISNLKVYPNPSNGMFTLSYSISGSDNVTVSVINELGQQVYTEQKQVNNQPITEQLNIENLAPGIYMLRIQTSKGITVQKLSVMR